MCESRVDCPDFLAKVRLQGCTAEKVGFNLTIYSMSGTSPPQLPSLQYCSNTDKFLEAFFHKAQTRILHPGMAMRSLVGKGGAPVMDDVENADGDGENGGVEEETMTVESDQRQQRAREWQKQQRGMVNTSWSCVLQVQ